MCTFYHSDKYEERYSRFLCAPKSTVDEPHMVGQTCHQLQPAKSLILWGYFPRQVRTLEKVLETEFDPTRRLHGYAREGIDMEREDFIDLAAVSKQVPGKTPAEVNLC